MELLKAAQAGNLDEVTRLLEQGADPNEPGREGFTPLIVAALGGHESIVCALLDGGADIDQCDEDGHSALAHAICEQKEPVFGLLLERGADPTLESWLAFDFAVRFGTIPMAPRKRSPGRGRFLRGRPGERPRARSCQEPKRSRDDR